MQRYSGLKDLLYVHMRKDDNILMVGAGNSRLSEDMYDDGFTLLTNIDASRVCIDQVSATLATCHTLNHTRYIARRTVR
jgi:EEF1A lysine methyltransferase 4